MNDEAAAVPAEPDQVVTVDLPDADATRAFGGELARELRAGDLVLLTGDLGAGKTTLTQGIGAGLGVRGQVASPTFVIARVHPSLVDGPALLLLLGDESLIRLEPRRRQTELQLAHGILRPASACA